ncbi:hypothetical protein GUITHDRAFT_82927 [Guillardia theta CCMP2712]|uniref:Post-GPI attachment to proteins factor 3 n=1 Tax=Guillardia theta (strain CCMP2712) TaxID=905079 RepID=L1I5U4_GUITC|nr:hypothetical protein GUITHDRAFT_82927 [Guillardia theta CCMP2712]EKX31633.1 hypothetical protein GUITHDRAFT_82927 [Guillardia theta CCMP2712]|eukprot:XP_005818613.1 hypothetical protein GUITHDRAFT_82927 [Guillardia theta CCMP2712]
MQADIPLSLLLRILDWDQDEDCAYRCLHACLAVAIDNGGRMWKYKGKWPHTRFLGMQEPASVLFSFFNAVSHVLGFKLLFEIRRNMVRTAGSTVVDRNLVEHVERLLAMSLLWVSAWMGSMVFHSRDNWATERLDYYLGNVAMVWMVYSAVMRAAIIHEAISGVTTQRVLQLSLFGGVMAHIISGWHKMNYSQNMQVMIVLMVANTCAWLSVCLKMKHNFVRLFYISTGLTYAAGALEIFDFPPVAGSLDAHAVWHLATPYLSWMFYRFLAQDAIGLVEQQAKRAS